MSKKVGWSIAALAGLLSGLAILLFYPASPDPHPSQSIVGASEVKPAKVRVQARLEKNLLEDNSADALHITVLDDSEQPLTALHLSLNAPGFALDQSNLPCQPAKVEPHQSCQFEVALLPATHSGIYGITAIVDWNQAATAGRNILLLGPITIDRTWGATNWSRAGRRIGALTLPIIIVVLGALFTNARAKQDERQEVRRLLLTRVMELAEQHYLPFVNHGKRIILEANNIQGKRPDAAPDKLFLQVLFLIKRMEVFRLTKGGVFLSTRDGERAVAAAWFLLKENIYAALGDENTAAALKVVSSDWDYATFKRRFAYFGAAWNEFQGWLAEPLNSNAARGSFWQILGTVDAFQAILAFEADSALSKHWYEESGKLEFMFPSTTLYKRASMGDYEKTKISVLQEKLRNQYQRTATLVEIP